MRIVVTGADGFIGRNLRVRLRELGFDDVDRVTRATTRGRWRDAARPRRLRVPPGRRQPPAAMRRSSRPATPASPNSCARRCARPARARPSSMSSSTQAALRQSPMAGASVAAEEVLERATVRRPARRSWLFRLPNVFGKWSRPNYNSAVATFCHNIARGLPITVNDPAAPLQLVYVDDVVEAFVALLSDAAAGAGLRRSAARSTRRPSARSRDTLAAVRRQPRDAAVAARSAPASCARCTRPTSATCRRRPSPTTSRATRDPRGVFVEMLKTPDCGQFSYFTAHPGVTRGEHYHHTKTEKFLVIARHGAVSASATSRPARRTSSSTRGGEGRIVETVPGWTHDITNVGDDELIVMLWANEIFDRARPDTVPMKVSAMKQAQGHDGRRHAAGDHPAVARDRRARRALRSRAGAHRPELRLRAQPDLLRRSRRCASRTTSSTARAATPAADHRQRDHRRRIACSASEQPGRRAGAGRHQQLPGGDSGQAPRAFRSSTWKRATAASTSACRRRSTAASSITPPTST